jgi:ribosomal protein L11 methyltransferase
MANFDHWLETSLECSSENAEAVAEIFSRFTPEGVVIHNITKFIPELQEEQATGMMRVAAYLPMDSDLEIKRQKLEEAIWHLNQIQPVGQLEFQTIADQDWMSLWKTHYRPIAIGKHLMILPAWAENDQSLGRLPVIIAPDMAFGTGSHPSTQLCLLALEKHGCKGMDLIDLGTGSGILAIAAARLGAARILAIDNDPRAIPSAIHNAKLNGFEENRIDFEVGSLNDVLARNELNQAPRVLANILAPILEMMLKNGLADLVVKGGLLILGGILKNQARDLISVAEPLGLRLVESLNDEDWVVLVLQKPHLEVQKPEEPGN